MRAISRGIYGFLGVFTIVGPLKADFSDTHVYNPAWPGHAKFHAGQTMSMGVALGSALLYLASAAGSSNSTEAASTRNNTAAYIASVYWVTQISAIFYPNSRASDDPYWGDSFPQGWISGVTLVVVMAAWLLERRDIAAKKAKAA